MNPLRDVVTALPREGRGSVLGPDNDRTARWWEMTLACGHIVERTARYSPHPLGWRARKRSAADLLPPPKRVRCEECGRSL